MKKYLLHLIFVLLLLLLFLHMLSRTDESFVVMTPPHTIKDYKKNHDRKKKSYCIIS
jgi:hypothetical protein